MNEFINKFRYPLVFLLGGLLFCGLSILYFNHDKFGSSSNVEIIDGSNNDVGSGGDETTNQNELVVEVSGGVEKPGVYKLVFGSRVEDALIMAGGMSQNADRNWVEKSLNRAARLTDGLKIYIPVTSDSGKQITATIANNSGVAQTASSQVLSENRGLVNVNTASVSELDTLPGIGPVYAQNIIEHRPYSEIAQLVSKGVIPSNVFEKIKEKISCY